MAAIIANHYLVWINFLKTMFSLKEKVQFKNNFDWMQLFSNKFETTHKETI